MKFAIALFLIATQLTACAPGLFSLNKKTLSIVAPDVPAIDKDDQKKAAAEMERGQCPALNIIINQCLITRDQSRAMKKVAK